MLAQNEAAMKMRPVLPSDSSVCESPPSYDSLFERRSSGKEHACLKAIYDVDGFEDVSETDELFYTWFHDPVPEFITPHVIGDKTASSDLHLHATSVAGAKKVDTPKFTVALLGSGLASELFFESLDMKVEVAIEMKTDLQDFVRKHSPSTTIYTGVRTVVQDLEKGALSVSLIRTDIVGGTLPCYAETSLAIYNNRETPHEDADLFKHYQLRYVAAVRPSAFFSEMTPPHAANGKSHDDLVKELEKLGYCVYVTDRLPACFCGDATHRDRWFVIAFLSTGPNFSVFDYCDNCTTPAEAILDPVDQVQSELEVMHPLVFRTRGEDKLPWGDWYANNPRVAGQSISRSSVAG